MNRVFRLLGRQVMAFCHEVYRMARYFVYCLGEFRRVYYFRRQVVAQLYSVGVDSLLLICLISTFSGMAVALQMGYQMEAYVPDYMVGSVVVRSVVLALSPVMMSLVLAGRVGAGIASEVGSMKVSEQVDALTAMAVDPIGYLMMPRVLAGLIMVPILVVFSCFVSMIAAYLIAVMKMGITPTDFLKGMKLDFRPYDVTIGLTKSTVYGGLITFIGCYMGLETRGGAQGVGRAATAAVVLASALILISDYVLTDVLMEF